MIQTYPLMRLIENRSVELGINISELVLRMGYANRSKGHRRLDELKNGDLKHANQLQDRLAIGLELPVEMIKKVVENTESQHRPERDADYALNFQPHAILLTAMPEPKTRNGRWYFSIILRIKFDPGLNPNEYVHQVMKQLSNDEIAKKQITGFIVKYASDNAVQFDGEGQIVTELQL